MSTSSANEMGETQKMAKDKNLSAEKKRERVRGIVREVTNAYLDTGNETDPDGMYTGTVRGAKHTGNGMYAGLSDTGTPTSAVFGGKTYQPVSNLQLERMDDRVKPQQDADDL